MRKAASGESLQMVHFEILQYLSICNDYSNTAQALSEYLGQTKGSISQSLKFVEDAGYIVRKRCKKDGRVIRIHLAEKGKACLKRINKNFLLSSSEDDSVMHAVRNLLRSWQNENGLRGFGQCKLCRLNTVLDNGTFQCGLTGDPLSKMDTQKICKEYEFEH